MKVQQLFSAALLAAGLGVAALASTARLADAKGLVGGACAPCNGTVNNLRCDSARFQRCGKFPVRCSGNGTGKCEDDGQSPCHGDGMCDDRNNEKCTGL
jgi:hypothetical protein